jgi:hypothetical protein
MPAKATNVQDYLRELEQGMEERPEQVKAGLEIYIELWRKTMAKGIVAPLDDVESALEKIEAEGGLYKAAGEE